MKKIVILALMGLAVYGGTNTNIYNKMCLKMELRALYSQSKDYEHMTRAGLEVSSEKWEQLHEKIKLVKINLKSL